MKIGVIADCHIGNHQLFKGKTKVGINERCELGLFALRAAYMMAAEQGCRHMIIAGDLFDTSAPSPQITTAIMSIIHAAAEESEYAHSIETTIIKGNHDSNSPNEGDHALGPLSFVATVVEQPTYLRRLSVALLPFRPHALDWLEDAVTAMSEEAGADGIGAVISHFGIADASTPLYMKHGGVSEAVIDSLAESYKIEAWLSGDWHGHKKFPSQHGCQIQQVGALVPTGFDNPGGDDLYGSLLVIDTGERPTQVTRHVVPGPRFYYSPDEPRMSKHTFLKLRADQAYREESCVEAVAAGELGGYVLAPDTETAAAASGAKVADEFAEAEVSGIDEALDTYVDKMPGLDPATRTDVKELCRKYIKGLH